MCHQVFIHSLMQFLLATKLIRFRIDINIVIANKETAAIRYTLLKAKCQLVVFVVFLKQTAKLIKKDKVKIGNY